MKTYSFLSALFLYLAFLPGLSAQTNTQLAEVLDIRADNPRFMPVKPGVNITAAEFLSRYKVALGLGPEDELVEQRIIDEPEMNMKHYRYRQLHGGVPVMEGDLLLHEKDGKLYLINGSVIPGLPAAAPPAMPEATALQKALEFVGVVSTGVGDRDNAGVAPENQPGARAMTEGKTVYVKDEAAGKYVLAYRFEVGDAAGYDKQAVFVDAGSGKVIFSYGLASNTNGIAHTRTNGIRNINTTLNPANGKYQLVDNSRGAKITVRDADSSFFEDDNNEWDEDIILQKNALDVFWGLEMAYDYFLHQHARNSYDNIGGDINAFVNINDQRPSNAAWKDNEKAMFVGVGSQVGEINHLPTVLDIVAHEFTHGVVQHSAKLKNDPPRQESNALDESFADIFATAIEFYAKPDVANWEFGESIYTNNTDEGKKPEKTSRQTLNAPRTRSMPDTYEGDYWQFDDAPSWDEHNNASVQSFWFYLLSEGGSGHIDDAKNDPTKRYTVKGIGIEKAAHIAYRNLTVYLTDTSTFMGAREGAIRAAIDLYGNCSYEHIQTQNAWYAVGLGEPKLMIDEIKITDSDCASATGSATVEIKGSAPLNLNLLTYQWSDPLQQTTKTAIDLEGNKTYSVTVTDLLNGCAVDTTFFLGERTNFDIELTSSNVSSCNVENGRIRVEITPSKKYGNLPVGNNFTYIWNTGASGSQISGLSPGIYTVTVTDNDNECDISKSKEVELTKPQIYILGGGTRTFCIDNLNNPITLSTLSTENIGEYKWSTGEVGSSISFTISEAVSIYSVTVTDPKGCIDSARTTVEIFIKDCTGDCRNTKFKDFHGITSCFEWRINILTSSDPNDMLGPPGYGEPRWVSVNDRLPYTIRFENDPEVATAPAQKVVIEHVPDEDLNLFSFQLGDFGFANQIFTVPPNQTYYSKRLDLRDSLGVYVDVNAGIDITQNKVFWIFQSVDPATGLPPTSPLLGLLSVNDTLLHNGEGFVNFTIKPKTTAATGDTVLAKAAIVFDQNETIYTPEIFNVIDAVAPASQIVTVLPAETDSLHHELCWTAQDDSGGCGLRDYALYVSQNGGSFYRHQDGIADTCTTFTGSPGSTYAFYTLASDNVGNTEALKPQGDTEVSINDAWRLFFYSINLDTFCAGDSIDLRWLATRVTGVDLFYSPDGAATLEPLADNLDAGAGFGWRIPDNHPGCTACAFIVADTAGVISDTVFAVIQPRPDIVPITDITDAGCPGSDNGAIAITAGGGTAPYTYLWNNGQSTNPATGLIAGIYTIVLTDAAGCSTSASAAVGEPAALLLGTTVANESCDGGADGAITLSVEGGTSPYSYLWSNGETTANISALAAGDYSVVVTDANTCTATATATVSPGAPEDLLTTAAIKVLLQGPYIAAVQLMHDSLRVKNLIPLTEPYTGMTNFTHTGGGGEQTTPAVLAVTGSDAVVDWVFLELRDAANPAVVLATRSALLQRDGDVVGVDGVSPVRFDVPTDSSYFLAVRHRNHLGVQLGVAVEYPVCDVVQTDFTTTPPEGFFDFNGLNPAQKTVSGKYVLWAGNGRVDTQLKYNGSNNDRTAILSIVGLSTQNAIVPGYLLADYNLDGQVKYNGGANDRNVLLGNVGITTPSAVVHDQTAR